MLTKLFSHSTCSAVAPNYNLISGGTVPEYWGTEADAGVIIPADGTIRNLRVNLAAAPGNSGSYDFTLMVNGVASALTCRVTDPATTASDTDHDIDIAAGDRVSIKIWKTDSPSQQPKARFMTEFEGDNADYSLILGSMYDGNIYGDNAQSLSCHGHSYMRSGTMDSLMVMPCAGKIHSLYVQQGTAPGAGKSWTYKVVKGEATTSDVSVTIADSDTTGNDTSGSVSVSAGDYISLYIVPDGSPATTRVRYGMVFEPSTPGDFVIMAGAPGGANSSTDTVYTPISVATLYGQTSETAYQNMGFSDFYIYRCQVKLGTAPGSGNSFTIKLRENEDDASTPLQVEISDSATTGAVEGIFQPADNGRLNSICIPDSTPDSGRLYLSYRGTCVYPSLAASSSFMIPLMRLIA